MASFTKEFLSASVDGRAIDVVATSTLGTLIHTASAEAGVIDELWLYAVNVDAAEVLMTVEDDAGAIISQVGVPAQNGAILVIPGFPYRAGVAVHAFAVMANDIKIGGFVNRITP